MASTLVGVAPAPPPLERSPTRARAESRSPTRWVSSAEAVSDSGVACVLEMTPYSTSVDWQESALVAFEHGDLRRPFVVGSLWSPIDKTIHDNKSQDGKNNYRTFFSRSGHVLQFIDEEGKERIVIQTKCGTGEAANEVRFSGEK